MDETLRNLLNWDSCELLLKLGILTWILLDIGLSSMLYMLWYWLFGLMPVFRHGVGFQAWCWFSGTMLVFRHVNLQTPCRFSGMMLVFRHGAGFQTCHRSSSISISCLVAHLEYWS